MDLLTVDSKKDKPRGTLKPKSRATVSATRRRSRFAQQASQPQQLPKQLCTVSEVCDIEEDAPTFSESQRDEVRELFALFDLNNDGALDINEFGSMLKTLGLRLNSRQTTALFDDMDTSANHSLEFEEFMTALAKIWQPMDEAGEINEAFRFFDIRNCGRISSNDFWRVMGAMDEDLTQEEANAMLRGATSSDHITHGQFMAMVGGEAKK